MEEFLKLENGLVVSFDWLSFTITTSRYQDVIKLLGYSQDDFMLCPKGARGYRSMLRLRGYQISILYDGSPGMGVHVDVSGTALSELLRSFSQTLACNCPFGGQAYEKDFDTTFMQELLRKVLEQGHVTRLDIAIDDVGCSYFSTDDLVHYYDQTRIVSKFRGMRNVEEKEILGKKTGHTLYFGSRSSDIFLRVYDKRLERNKKLISTGQQRIQTPWIRWELELKKDRAVSVANMFASGLNLGMIAIGILGHYFRIINLDDSNRSRCSVLEEWKDFMAGISPLKVSFPRLLPTMEDKKNWIRRQCMPTLAAIVLGDGGSLDFIESSIADASVRMSQTLYDLAMHELGN
nr:MAG TPA: Replication initiation factor [Inoviridae sp.]